jgi:integrase
MVRREVTEYLRHLEKERDVSPHTVKAYGRDLEAFTDFCDRHYGTWNWETVDRLGLRGFLGELQRRGLSKRSAARALSAVRSFYRFLQEHQQREYPSWRSGCPDTSTAVRLTGSSSGPSRVPVETSWHLPAISPSWSSSIRPGSGFRS